MEKKILCHNCGASIEQNVPRCPYCGAINEIGAEKKYMGDLEEIKEDLSELEQVPEQLYKKEVKKSLKTIIIAMVATAVVVFALLGIWSVVHNRLMNGNGNTVSQKEQLLWENENFPKLDAWFEAEDYDAINQLIGEAGEAGYSLQNWEHYWFMNTYNGCMLCIERRELIKSDLDTAKFVLGEILYVLYSIEEDFYPEEDWARLQEFRPVLEEILYEDMKFTKEEADSLYEKCSPEGWIDYDISDAYMEEIWERFAQ